MREFWESLGISAALLVAGFTIHSYLEGIPLLWECFLYVIVVLLAVGIYRSLRQKHRPRKGRFMVTSGPRRAFLCCLKWNSNWRCRRRLGTNRS